MRRRIARDPRTAFADLLQCAEISGRKIRKKRSESSSFVLHFHPSLDRLKQRHIIGILQIAADGNAFGKPRDLYALRL